MHPNKLLSNLKQECLEHVQTVECSHQKGIILGEIVISLRQNKTSDLQVSSDLCRTTFYALDKHKHNWNDQKPK